MFERAFKRFQRIRTKTSANQIPSVCYDRKKSLITF
jgi:hypothetical protein